MSAPPGPKPVAPAQRLLQAVVDRFAEAGRELPERRYLLAGQAAGAAWDDEHLSVSLNAVQPGMTAESTRGDGPARHVGRMVIPRGVYEIRIVRCWPTVEDDGSVPDADEITAATETAMGDAGEILAALYAFAERDKLGTQMRPGEIQPIGPLGGLVGYSVVVTLSPLQ